LKWSISGIPDSLEPGQYNIKIDRISLPHSGGEPVVHAQFIKPPKDHLSELRQTLAKDEPLGSINWPAALIVLGVSLIDQLGAINDSIRMLDRDVQALSERTWPQ
jgi:hypothetical protein